MSDHRKKVCGLKGRGKTENREHEPLVEYTLWRSLRNKAVLSFFCSMYFSG